MTREEAKPYIGELQMYVKSRGWDEEYLIACDIALNELEQESAIDKIRAEIDTYLEIEGFGSEYRNDIKGIIDKYKAEQE